MPFPNYASFVAGFSQKLGNERAAGINALGKLPLPILMAV